METIADGGVVEMNYTLTNGSGEVLDSSQGQSPLAYIHGRQNIIPGLERQMVGKKVGDRFRVEVVPEEAYGTWDEAMVQTVPKSYFEENAVKVSVGMQFQVENHDGEELVVTATEVRETEVVLDGNHPLAGETLHFDVEVISLRDATAEELANGEIKSEGDCCSENNCC